MLVHDLHLVALEHRHVEELPGVVAAVVLDDEQARRGDLEHEAERGHRPRGAPDLQLAVDPPDAEVDAGALDGRRHPRQGRRAERQRMLELQRLGGLRPGGRNASEIFGT